MGKVAGFRLTDEAPPPSLPLRFYKKSVLMPYDGEGGFRFLNRKTEEERTESSASRYSTFFFI